MQQAAELSVPAPTIEAALDGRFLSGLKEQRMKAAAFYEKYGVHAPAAPSVRDASRDGGLASSLATMRMPINLGLASKCSAAARAL